MSSVDTLLIVVRVTLGFHVHPLLEGDAVGVGGQTPVLGNPRRINRHTPSVSVLGGTRVVLGELEDAVAMLEGKVSVSVLVILKGHEVGGILTQDGDTLNDIRLVAGKVTAQPHGEEDKAMEDRVHDSLRSLALEDGLDGEVQRVEVLGCLPVEAHCVLCFVVWVKV